MFKTLEIRGVLGCFLFPVHAGQIRAALERLEAHQAVLALVPDRQTLRVILHCEDFSRDIGSHRLWFAGGEDWQEGLSRLFVGNPGLPTPADFIRAISADQSAADGLIAPAQKIFADETSRRSVVVQSIATGCCSRANARPTLCVVAPSHFRLWNDAPKTLVRVLGDGGEFGCRFFDSDDPASASPLGLAMSVAGADAVVTANLSRGDLPPVVGREIPVVTWVTLPRIPERDPSAGRDALILADPGWAGRARAQGWPDDRIHLATWPTANVRAITSGDGGPASLIADTAPIVPPKAVNEFSSHLLLWDLIASEIRRDASVLGDDVEAYLAGRVRKFRIDRGAFNGGLFIEHLIIPAYQQSVARALIARRVALRLYGKGWDAMEEFAAFAGGPVNSREQFGKILAGSGALVHAWPVAHVHPIEATGLALIRPGHLAGREDVGPMPALSAGIIRAALA
jgi:hypothetical protein